MCRSTGSYVLNRVCKLFSILNRVSIWTQGALNSTCGYQQFLANDVTKVMSWLMSKAKRMVTYNIQYLSSSVRSGGGGFGGWDVGWGCANRHTETLRISGTCPYSLYYIWEYDPRALKCFAINRNYLMLLRMHCFVYFRSGRILFVLYSCI